MCGLSLPQMGSLPPDGLEQWHSCCDKEWYLRQLSNKASSERLLNYLWADVVAYTDPVHITRRRVHQTHENKGRILLLLISWATLFTSLSAAKIMESSNQLEGLWNPEVEWRYFKYFFVILVWGKIIKLTKQPKQTALPSTCSYVLPHPFSAVAVVSCSNSESSPFSLHVLCSSGFYMYSPY